MSSSAEQEPSGVDQAAEAVAPSAVEPSRRRRPAPLMVIAVIALIAGATSAGWYGIQWVKDASSSAGETARVRDQALADARQAAINLTTVDSADVQRTLSNWDSVVTGDLATQFSTSRSQLAQQLTVNPGSTQVSLVNAALSALDVNAGTATALIFADVTTTKSAGGNPVAQRFALNMTVQRTDNGWKASGLQSLAQNAAGK